MQSFFSIINLPFVLYVGLGAVMGLLVGALPGLSAITGVALVVSISYTWGTTKALAMIMGVYVLACFSGSITAILMNIPGAPAAVATTLDGYPLAKKGEAKKAVLTSVVYSTLGSVVGIIALVYIAKPMSLIALHFSPMDYFLLSVFGLATVGSIASKDYLKGLLCSIIGVLFSCVGIDPIMGIPRFTFGIQALVAGIPTIPALIGLFGLSEVLDQLSVDVSKAEMLTITKQKVHISELLRCWKTGIKGSLIGLVIGVLPGAGAPVASLLSYDNAKKSIKNPSVPFGEGAVEGIAASESANNAVIGGALIPMLALGIPGDSVTTIILSVFYIHGLIPGPLLFTETPELFSIIIAGGLVGCMFLLLLGYTTAPLLAKVVQVPRKILFPIILVLCCVGAYANNNSLYEVLIMTIFGVIGYYMKKNDYSPAAMVLGMVLGTLMDNNFRRAASLAIGSENPFANMFLHPITIILLFMIVISLLSNNKTMKKKIKSLFLKKGKAV
jgi:putative tricarboxylic transport membrane protein